MQDHLTKRLKPFAEAALAAYTGSHPNVGAGYQLMRYARAGLLEAVDGRSSEAAETLEAMVRRDTNGPNPAAYMFLRMACARYFQVVASEDDDPQIRRTSFAVAGQAAAERYRGSLAFLD